MTNITEAELKLLYIEIMLIAIIGVFLYFYNQSPIKQGVIGADGSATLVTETLGIPISMLIVSSIFLIPMTIMNIPILARLVKDFLTQWV